MHDQRLRKTDLSMSRISAKREAWYIMRATPVHNAYLLFVSLLVFAAAITLACGSPASPHIPQSVTVTPATADAESFPDGQVQFAATAYYNTMPSPVSNVTATWNSCAQNGPTTEVSVSTTGVAQCASGASGTYMIYAFVPDPNFKGVCSGSALPCAGACGGVVGTAQLICP
jgi:hypothetical protein